VIDVSPRQFLVLHAVLVKGVASTEAMAGFTGLPDEVVAHLSTELAEEGLIKVRQGRIPGAFVTQDGRAAHQELLAAAVKDAQHELAECYNRFLAVNDRFKRGCVEWQKASLPTSGTDPAALTAADISELGSWLTPLHDAVGAALNDLAMSVPRFQRYHDRLAEAFARLRLGDRSALLKPMSDSYHDVWMELHQDLLMSLGRQRGTEDGT
jgi:hypothetical protein